MVGKSFPPTIDHDSQVEDLPHARLGITADGGRCCEVCVLDILIHDPFNVNIGWIQVYLESEAGTSSYLGPIDYCRAIHLSCHYLP